MNSCFALVDCNNFYASCERLFRPDLRHVPVVVLSNNDGCIVARSAEAKSLGIKMATPLFKAQALIKRHGVQVFSSNYALYADISQRVMQTLESFSPQVEIYSIDEAFLDLCGVRDLTLYGGKIRTAVGQNIGIPVCVGIAPTKTLAKLANHAAKIYKATGGVVDLMARERQQRLLALTPVADLWGVGRRTATGLLALGIRSGLDLAQSPAAVLRKRFSVVMERIICELNGEPCFALEDAAPPKQQIVCSRSFGEKTQDYTAVRQSICEFAARAAEKLRAEGQLANQLQVFIRTSSFCVDDRSYANAVTGRLAQASADTRDIVGLAVRLFDRLWQEGYPYAKAGVMLGDFCSRGHQQLNLFADRAVSPVQEALMTAVDQVNAKGGGKIWFGGQRPQQDWFMKQGHLSPAYTTRWESLPLVGG